MFWPGSSAQQAAPPPAPAPPKAYVFSTGHMHVHHSEHFLKALEEAMELPVSGFRIALSSVEEHDNCDDPVSVTAVIHMAKIMSTFSSLRTVYAEPGGSALHLMLEIGKTLHLLTPRDKVVVFTDVPLAQCVLDSAGVTCVDLREQYAEVFMRQKLLR